MKRFQLVLVLLVAAVVLTAGCAGLAGDDSANGNDTTETSDDGDTDPDTDDGSDDTDTSADDPDDESSDGDTPGDSPTDAADWTVTDPEAPLNEAGSYTNTWTWRSSFEEGDSSGEMTTTTLVDADAARASTTMQVGGEAMEYFYADGKQYTRFGSGDGASYFVVDAEFDDVGTHLDYGYIFDSGDHSEWTPQGVETYNGVTVQRYTYEGPNYWTELGQDPNTASFSPQGTFFEMLVDADGIARYQSYRVEGVDETGTEGWFEWEYTLTDVGSTTVADPPWLEEAEPLAY